MLETDISRRDAGAACPIGNRDRGRSQGYFSHHVLDLQGFAVYRGECLAAWPGWRSTGRDCGGDIQSVAVGRRMAVRPVAVPGKYQER